MDSIAKPPLSDAVLASLSERGDLHAYARGDESSRELVYNMLQPGEFFGEMFLDGGPRSASAKAATDVQCVVVGPDEFRAFMKDYPEFAESLVLKLIARVRHSTQQIRSLALSGVFERTVTLIDRLAMEVNGVRLLPASVTQQEIADRVGATREMVNHIFRDLARGGYIDRDDARRTTILKDLPRQL